MRYIVVPIRALVAVGASPEASCPPPVRPEPSLPVTIVVPEAVETPVAPPEPDALTQWISAVQASRDACLVVDGGGHVAGLSPPAAEMLGTVPTALVGRSLDEALNLVDFTNGAQEAQGAARRIPPLIAVRENSLSRGMMRVRRPDGGRLMLDAVAAPIHDSERKPIGSISFLSAV